ncbi:FAD-dependent monooxygenase [Qaidamihabitans albus]|uniref:FAD-dependent monooxygenase n=1 Tax=Qaidamihabitans albus TaxID=2795733 RepID=UPI0027DB48E1|nr:FAD-dependent monooxygenase [Qaidamihabitans albus]
MAGELHAAGALKRTMPIHPGPTSHRPLLSFDFTELDQEADRAGVLFLEQGETERLLLAAVRDSGWCDVRFGTEAVALDARPDGVQLTVDEGAATRTLTAAFVVGCDGTGSFVRDAVEIPFPGVTFPLRPTLADVRIDDDRDALPWPRLHNGRRGITGAQRLRPGHWRIIRVESGAPVPGEPVPGSEVRARAAEVLGDGPVEVVWASRFQFQRRASPRFRSGRVLLAGDAAHAFPPANGQGMNAGIQDAHNLAWKLANAVRGGDLDGLLDSYEVERRAMVGRVSRHVSLLTRIGLQAPRPVRAAVFQLMRLGLAVPASRRERLRNLAMIDLRVPASPLLDGAERAAGVRLPNPVLRSPTGATTRLYDLVDAGPCLLQLAGATERAVRVPGVTTVRIGPGGHRDPSGSLARLLGGDTGWLLVRPDLHLAWARTGAAGLRAAVARALGYRATL